MKSEQEIVRSLTVFIVNEVAPAKPATAPAPDDDIFQSGLVDSMGLYRVIEFVEDEFGVKVAPDEIMIENFGTVKAITRLILAKQSG